MTAIMTNFIGTDCVIKCKGRDEIEFTGKILSLDSSGVVAEYSSHGRSFQVYVPSENLSYIERKILND